MKLLATLTLLAVPSLAWAAPTTGIASFSGTTAAMPEKVVANETLWRCNANGCSGPSEERKVSVQKACKDLARKIGLVEALSVGKTTLGADDLAACNKGAKGAPS